ncbi:septum formation family protein [Clavibacter sp. VKM Ac-2872]|uniref:septum formation family protein n=1 Tax=Clavibacter sp. VKM Ac-2872 TaxID=2783812 RepID=UPI00351B4ACE
MQVRAAGPSLWLVLLAAVVGLAGCTSDPTPEPAPAPSTPVLNTQAAARQLQVGDCFDTSDLAEPSADHVQRDCSSGHEDEVYARIALGDDTARPDDDHLQASASQKCLDAFEPYVGRKFDDSDLGYSYVYPSVDAWPLGDHEAVCYLVDHASTPLTKSMRNSGA